MGFQLGVWSSTILPVFMHTHTVDYMTTASYHGVLQRLATYRVATPSISNINRALRDAIIACVGQENCTPPKVPALGAYHAQREFFRQYRRTPTIPFIRLPLT